MRSFGRLDMSRYLGRWVEVAKFPLVTSPLVGSGYGPDLDCVTSWYDNENTGSIYRVTNTGVRQVTNERVTITGINTWMNQVTNVRVTNIGINT